jgi:hypothetical protein
MQNEDTPGLAMSRSIGDGLAHTIGVSWEPGKFKFSLRVRDLTFCRGEAAKPGTG